MRCSTCISKTFGPRNCDVFRLNAGCIYLPRFLWHLFLEAGRLLCGTRKKLPPPGLELGAIGLADLALNLSASQATKFNVLMWENAENKRQTEDSSNGSTNGQP